ncbi:SHOCT domain-containing protein [Agromyces sp. Root1464]|uniref:SHOCT domain-containing protein n=1 Tax=Agromyces sp. Root1464 TaxID=1736467 RepID=UPI001F27B3B2|nr:SHOCT domain-containing protein [Agromyces sp. Root1464]
MPLRRMGRPGLIGMAARTAVVAGTATAVSGSVQRHQQEKAQGQYEQQQYEAQQQQAQIDAAAQQAVSQQQAAMGVAAQQAVAAPAAPAAGVDLVGELQKLAALQQQGILSPEEFAAAKAKLLG